MNTSQSALGSSTLITVEVENSTSSDIRMVDATVFFDDALGNHIGGWALPRDMLLPKSQPIFIEIRTFGADRLMKADANDILATLCTKSAVRADGMISEF